VIRFPADKKESRRGKEENMRLLVQSDDFGITPAVSLGIIEAIKNGIVRNTGLFANMSWAGECVEMIRPYLDRIAFGIDLNVSAGRPVLPPEEVPELVQESGEFLTSAMNRARDTDENNHDHVNYDQVFREFDAQVMRFSELVGKLPDYIHGHAYGTETTVRAMKAIAKKYNRPFSTDILFGEGVKGCTMEWYRFGNKMEDQFQDDLKTCILEDRSGFLQAQTGSLVSHCGYIDMELFALSSYTVYRIKDLEALTSPEVKAWVRENKIELITYHELWKEMTKSEQA
jgi:predicted glycoside hydrolase/deacetylase ChbG (UPF0249 family)